jgi:hypothetical protein
MSYLAILTASAVSHRIADSARIALSIVAIYLCLLCAIAIHETGHWVAAKACGFLPLEFRVGILRWLPKAGWGFQWRWANFASGWVRAQPTQGHRRFRLRYLSFVLAGPLFNIFACVAIMLIDHGQTRLEGAAIFVVMFSWMIGVSSLVPFQHKMLRSDGLQVFDVLSPSGFRRLRFVATYVDSKDELVAALRSQNFERARLLSESVLVFAVESPQTEDVMKALHRILEISEQGIRAQKEQSVLDAELVKDQ